MPELRNRSGADPRRVGSSGRVLTQASTRRAELKECSDLLQCGMVTRVKPTLGHRSSQSAIDSLSFSRV